LDRSRREQRTRAAAIKRRRSISSTPVVATPIAAVTPISTVVAVTVVRTTVVIVATIVAVVDIATIPPGPVVEIDRIAAHIRISVPTSWVVRSDTGVVWIRRIKSPVG